VIYAPRGAIPTGLAASLDLPSEDDVQCSTNMPCRCLSFPPSGNQSVRFSVRRPRLTDTSGLTAWGSFDGHPWLWLPINVLRCQMVHLHSFMVTGPMRMGWLGSELPFSTLTGHLAQQHSTDRLRAGGRRPWVLPRQRRACPPVSSSLRGSRPGDTRTLHRRKLGQGATSRHGWS